MYVISGKESEVIMLDQFAKVKVVSLGEGNDKRYMVSAYPVDKSVKATALGEYYHSAIANAEFGNLVNAIEIGKRYYRMARSLYDAEETEVYDSRVRRRGGS